MTIDEAVKKLETEHYCVNYEVFHNLDANKWMGKVRVHRKDTDEIINSGFFRVVDPEKSVVEEKLLARINTTLVTNLKALGVPYEWKSPMRPILLRCLKFRRFISKFGGVCDDVIAGKMTNDEFTEIYVSFWNRLISESLAITRNIEALTNQERINILTSPDEVFDDPSDPWSLDDLDARDMVFKFFLNPSDDEITAHDQQLSRLKDRFNELGWEN